MSSKRNFIVEEPEPSFNINCADNPTKKIKMGQGDKTQTVKSIVASNSTNSNHSNQQSCAVHSTTTSTIVAGSSKLEIGNFEKIMRNIECVKQRNLRPELLNTLYKLAESFNDPVIKWKQQRDAVNNLYLVMKDHLLGMLHDQKAFDILVNVFHRGRAPIKKSIFARLEGNFLEIAKADNGKRLIEILLKEPKLKKTKVIRDFFGNAIELLKDDLGSHVVETIYVNSTSEQKTLLISEFYGSEFGNHHNGRSILKLDDIADQNAFQRSEILRVMSRNILGCLNEKTFKHTIIQDIIIEYLTYVQFREDQEITARINRFVAPILHTQKGIHVARLCFYHAREKDHRIMLKSIRSKVPSLCKNQYGHLLIINIFESVKSIDLIRKMVITEIIRNLQNIMENDYGSACLVHLLTGRSTLLPQESMKALSSMDHIRSQASQQEVEEKMTKLARRMSPTLLQYICKDPAKFFVNQNTGMLLCVILLYANGNSAKAVNELIEFIRNTPPQENIMLSPYNR
ncbi:14483_t:CDS:1, partial [Ambispora leptoticha]